jgi:type I restriction enzyme R subunit
MTSTSFWSPDGTPISSAQFIKRLFGELPELFKDEDELRAIWSMPDTRKKLLDGLEEKGYGGDQLLEMSRLIEAENSDLFDVLAYVSFAQPTITRAERVNFNKDLIYSNCSDSEREFLSFVLGHYVAQGVSELDESKLPDLLELKYHSVADSISILGSVGSIRNTFIGFQKHLYASENLS